MHDNVFQRSMHVLPVLKTRLPPHHRNRKRALARARQNELNMPEHTVVLFLRCSTDNQLEMAFRIQRISDGRLASWT